MLKILIVSCFVDLIHGAIIATWISGYNHTSTMMDPVYGTMGIPSRNNVPGPYLTPLALIPNNTLWLFGGLLKKIGGVGNVLWRFNVSTLEWTWMSGNAGSNPSPFYPNERSDHCIHHYNNSIFIFGGYGYQDMQHLQFGVLNDVCRYSIAENRWYLNISTPPINIPPRSSMACSIVGKYMYVYGGSDETKYMGDLWNFNFETLTWTMISNGTISPNYGIKGEPKPGNNPGPRYLTAVATVSALSSFFMFGGSASDGSLNDLWAFNTSSQLWSWESGSNTTNSLGKYSDKMGQIGKDYFPPSRNSHTLQYESRTHRLWLFGGQSTGYYNDLWVYDISKKMWGWMAGSLNLNGLGNFGVLNVPSLTNWPEARLQVAAALDFTSNLLYIWGGIAVDFVSTNDLWTIDFSFAACSLSPCNSGGTCIESLANYSFSCNCANGYSGNLCETNIDECSSFPCLNGGSCYDQVDGYNCSCTTGFKGIYCEINIDECASFPCLNDGKCVDGIDSYSCICNKTVGDFCETIAPCISLPCMNDGKCINVRTSLNNSIYNYSCICENGYWGNICEFGNSKLETKSSESGTKMVVGIVIGIAIGIVFVLVFRFAYKRIKAQHAKTKHTGRKTSEPSIPSDDNEILGTQPSSSSVKAQLQFEQLQITSDVTN